MMYVAWTVPLTVLFVVCNLGGAMGIGCFRMQVNEFWKGLNQYN